MRTAAASDRADILAIAAQTWGGDDYLPDVIDDWLQPGAAQLIVATGAGKVAGLARYVSEFPGFAWLEGLRVDPAWQGQGIAKALTQRLVAMADEAGVELAALSTYIDNLASQKVSASFGFEQVVGFAFGEGKLEPVLLHAQASPRAVAVPPDEAREFIFASESLAVGAGYLPHSWRFYPFRRDPDFALSRMERVVGIREAGRLAALLCCGDHTPHGAASFSIDFLEGEPGAMRELARHALTFVRDEKYLDAMVPCRDGKALPSLDALLSVGFQTWYEGKPDVIVFERKRQKAIAAG
jgi:GNAT superfamily N-acetyltransferase